MKRQYCLCKIIFKIFKIYNVEVSICNCWGDTRNLEQLLEISKTVSIYIEFFKILCILYQKFQNFRFFHEMFIKTFNVSDTKSH